MRRRLAFVTLALLALAVAACARRPAAPYALDFSLSGASPRLLQTSEQTDVPLVVTNTGLQAWDPGRVHLSYHWLWLVPRELASRSRRLPYQEGIRSNFDGLIGPGEHVALRGRILAPTFPGIYWLQWDMVEEGVTWFVQVSPRQPRRLVVVLPSVASMVVPFPLLAALAGLLVIGRLGKGRVLSPPLTAFAGVADLVWCAAALVGKPFVLFQTALLEPSPAGYWLTMGTAVAAPLLLALTPRRGRSWLALIVGVAGSLVITADVLYYRYFGDMVSSAAVLAAGQTPAVWQSIRSLLTPDLIWLVVDIPFAAWLALRMSRVPAPPSPARLRAIAATGLAALVAAGAAGVPRALADVDLGRMFRARAVVESLGPFGYHVVDGWTYFKATMLTPPPTEAQRAEVRGWFAARAPLRRGVGPWFGAARGRNLIVIQVESLQDFAVDATVDGQEVMPHLRRWSDHALRFTDVTDQTNEGRTSDAEFTSLVSLLPLDRGAVAFRYPGDQYVGLPRVLAEHGYSTLSAVPFEPGFWNRRLLHPTYGFERSLFDDDFQMTEQIGWGLNDRDFLQQMVPRLERLQRPFFTWLITLSLHHPFDDFPDRDKVLKLGALDKTPLGGYLHGMHFFDQALADFIAALKRDGLLDQTVIALFGDHDAGLPWNPALAHLAEAHLPAGSLEATWRLVDRVPFFIRVPGSGPPERDGLIGIPAGQTDFAPTLLALLGIDPAPLPWVGRNLLGEPGDPPVVRPFGEWLDSDYLLMPADRPEDLARSCYALAASKFAPPRDCASADARARRESDVSHLVIADDLQQQLRTELRQLVH
ncbi:MAG: LTA synthase family protein [Betaproteobacteria bacterium]